MGGKQHYVGTAADPHNSAGRNHQKGRREPDDLKENEALQSYNNRSVPFVAVLPSGVVPVLKERDGN